MTIDKKFRNLQKSLKNMDRVIVAFSGGVDSTFLLKAASVSGLSSILAVTGVSESLPEEECTFAKDIASSMNINHTILNTEEMQNSSYTSNPPDRCYYCKKELFGKLKELAKQENYTYVLDGTNADDAHDWRPGKRAAGEEGVISPLLEAGLTKDEIRKLSKDLRLPTWNKPATPCLASRFPYGQHITSKALGRVHQAETFIKRFGPKELRVRIEGSTARIEIMPEDFSKLIDNNARTEIINHLKSLGFNHITLDLQGFRSGSSNEALPDKRN
jgi:uncharacterized protein